MPPAEAWVLIELLLIAFIASALLVHDRASANPWAVVALVVASASALLWWRF